MDKIKCFLAGFFKGTVILFFLSVLLTACSLEGNIEARRQKSHENPDPSIPEPGSSLSAPGAPIVIASDGILTVRWTAVEEAESYEVYVSTSQKPPASPQRTVSVTTTVLDMLSNKTVYYVWVKAINKTGYSDFSPHTRGIPWPGNEVPATPGRPVIIPGINQLTVNWEETGGASSYEVYVNTTPSAPYAPVVTSDKTSAVVNYLGDGNILENGVIYYIWVRAVNNVGKSAYSPVEAGTPRIPTVAPAAPSRPVLTAGNRKLSVSWQTVELTSAYEVWFGTSNDSAQAQKYGGDTIGTEIVITGLVNETTYYVWIKAKNVVGTSGFSLSANARPSAFVAIPETPTTPSVISGNRELSVSWQTVEGALFYEVWTGTTSNSAYATKHGADISGTSITLTGLANGTTYYIWIKAKNNIGISEFSPVASGIPSASAGPPLAPQSAPSVTSGNRGLTLSWQAEEGASAYELWAGTTPNSNMATKRGNDVSALSGAITGLSNETTYYVWIKAKNSMGTSGFSPMASGMPSITPGLYRGVEKIGNQNLSAALSYISANAVNGDNFSIFLGADETVSPTTLNYPGKTVGITLIGYGGERKITLASNGSMFTINSVVTLTLNENITLIGRDSNSAALVYVNYNGSLIINDDAKISGNTSSGSGGGIFVYGTVNMNGGTISGNTVTYQSGVGGGISIGYTGTVTMNGGTISGNTATGYNGSVGGIQIGIGTFTMNGGTISGNTGGGIYTSGGTFNMNGGIINDNTGFGIDGGGTVNLNTGTISGNTGTGISITSGTVTMNDGMSIIGNNNGIYVSSNGAFTMNGGTISENNRHGIIIMGGTVTMNGGIINGNTTTTPEDNGGGIYVGMGTFTMHGGVISGNTANSYGGGIYVSSSGTFKKLPPSGGGQNSGIIYGSEAVGVDAEGIPLKNTASSDANGHAVYFSSTQKRNTTVGQMDYIDTTTGRGLSANGNAPFGE